MSVIVFLGPSLPRREAMQRFDADYRPPVALGDVYRAALEEPECIAIIDGVFHHQPAVWHKEILYALAQGIEVVGASSMGALRAAETHPMGMRGVGRIFELYRVGVIEADDEVAVVHGDARTGYRASSVAMVNIRCAVQEMEDAGLLAPAEAAALVDALRRTHYPERTWPAVVAAVRTALGEQRAAAVASWLDERRPDQKRDDARLLLSKLAAGEFRGDRRPKMPFERTFHWDRMVMEEDPAYRAAAGLESPSGPET